MLCFTSKILAGYTGKIKIEIEKEYLGTEI
jgi:hypothetical protein